MGYKGETAPIRIGHGGLFTDFPPNDIPDTHLIEANNVTIQDGTLQKDKGSRRWNFTALASGLACMREFYPTEAKGYVYVATKGGLLHRFENRESQMQITRESATTDPSPLAVTETNVFLVEGGQEAPGNSKKIFVFTGNNQIQVITGSETTYTTISGPSADFTTGNYPKVGIVHRNRLWVLLDHRAYASSATDHEQFASGGLQFAVHPGEGLGLSTAFIFRKQLFFFKRGGGIYQLIDSDPDTDNWYIQRLSKEAGFEAHDAMLEIVGDVIAANDKGSITSLRAVDTFGDVDPGDVLNELHVKRYLMNKASINGWSERRAIYDESEKQAYFTLRPNEAIRNNALWKFDFSTENARITLVTKDQANCLAMLRVPVGREKPFYGAEDGYIYEMNCEDREVGLVHNPIAPVATIGAAGSMIAGSYRFVVTFSNGTSESLMSAPTEAITVTNERIELTQIPVDTTGNATKRIVWGKLAASTSYLKVAEIADNTTTTYTVNTAIAGWTTATNPSKNTFNTAYEMSFQTSHLTMKHVNPVFESVQKHFEFIQIGYHSTGEFPMELEYWIDGVYKRSRDFTVYKGALLDDFLLDTDRLAEKVTHYVVFKLHGTGTSISLRGSNAGQLENGIITNMYCLFRVSNHDQKAILTGRKAR